MSRDRWSRTEDGLWLADPGRRAIVKGASAGAAALFLGCASDGPGAGGTMNPGGGGTGTGEPSVAPTMPGGRPVDCIVRAEQTEGPFPNRNDDPMRADIRSEPSDGAVKPGVPLRLVLRLGQVQGGRCLPIAGAHVDVWQCDAQGIYAGYEDAPGKKFLRGYLPTDASGTVEFLTIYPGPYQPRPVHIHFSVRMSRTGAIRSADPGTFVSQLYFPLEVSREVVQSSPVYNAGAAISNNSAADRPWVLTMERDGAGWRGLLDVGLALG